MGSGGRQPEDCGSAIVPRAFVPRAFVPVRLAQRRSHNEFEDNELEEMKLRPLCLTQRHSHNEFEDMLTRTRFIVLIGIQCNCYNPITLGGCNTRNKATGH